MGILLTSKLLQTRFNISLASGGTGSWILDPNTPKYFIIKIQNV